MSASAAPKQKRFYTGDIKKIETFNKNIESIESKVSDSTIDHLADTLIDLLN